MKMLQNLGKGALRGGDRINPPGLTDGISGEKKEGGGTGYFPAGRLQAFFERCPLRGYVEGKMYKEMPPSVAEQ